MPEREDPEWAIIELGHLPLLLMADQNHPLAGEKGLLAQDLHSFPSLALPDGLYPRSQSLLLAQGLWKNPVLSPRYRRECWEDRTADRLTLCYGNDFVRALSPNPVRLDRDLGCLCQVALVAHGDLAGHGVLRDLATVLRQRLIHLLAQQPSLDLVTMA